MMIMQEKNERDGGTGLGFIGYIVTHSPYEGPLRMVEGRTQPYP